MESKTEHWVSAFVIALVTHAGLVAALVVAWPSGTLPNPRSVGPDLTSSSGTAPIRVQLLGSLLRSELLHTNAPSEPSEITKAHPRRARTSTLKAKTDKGAAEAHNRDGPADSNSSLGENGSPEFTAADDRASACCSDDRTGARFSAVESRGTQTGSQAAGSGASELVAELHRRLA